MAEEHEGLPKGVVHPVGALEAGVLVPDGAEHVVVGEQVVHAEPLGLEGEGDDVGGAPAELVLGDHGTDLHRVIMALPSASGSAVPCGATTTRGQR